MIEKQWYWGGYMLLVVALSFTALFIGAGILFDSIMLIFLIYTSMTVISYFYGISVEADVSHPLISTLVLFSLIAFAVFGMIVTGLIVMSILGL